MRRYRGLIIAVEQAGEHVIGATHWRNTKREARDAARRMWRRSHAGRHHQLRCWLAVVFEEMGPEPMMDVEHDGEGTFAFTSRKRGRKMGIV
jgi:hypothetical protein